MECVWLALDCDYCHQLVRIMSFTRPTTRVSDSPGMARRTPLLAALVVWFMFQVRGGPSFLPAGRLRRACRLSARSGDEARGRRGGDVLGSLSLALRPARPHPVSNASASSAAAEPASVTRKACTQHGGVSGIKGPDARASIPGSSTAAFRLRIGALHLSCSPATGPGPLPRTSCWRSASFPRRPGPADLASFIFLHRRPAVRTGGQPHVDRCASSGDPRFAVHLLKNPPRESSNTLP